MDSKELLFNNFIQPTNSGKRYRCHVCTRRNKKGNKVGLLVGDLSDAKNHIQSYSHQNFLKMLSTEDQICSKNPAAIFINVRYCTQCQVCLRSDEIFRYHCLIHFYKTYKDYIIDTDIIKFNFYEDGKILINCLLCNVNLNDEKMLALHLKSISHTNRLNLISKRQKTKLQNSINCEMNSNLTDKFDITVVQYCTLCDEKILESNVIEHSKKKNHNEDILLNLEFEDNELININLSDLYICFICDKSYSNQMLYLNHFNSKEHIYISRWFHQILKNDNFVIETLKFKGVFYCKTCCKHIHHIKTAISHINGLNHSLKVRNTDGKINQVSNASTSALIPVCTVQNDYIQKLDLENESDTETNTCDNPDNLLNKLVSLDLSDKEKRRVSIIKNKKNGKKSKSYLQSHFDKNLYSFANVYIEMCIEPGIKNIYNIELDLNAAINISYLVKNLWYYAQVFLCNICRKRIEFELDFIIHLTSANHIKKLNKLKLKNKEVRFHICPICVTYWYGEADEFDKHFEEISHKQCLNGQFVVPSLSRIVTDLLTGVDENVNHLLNISNKTYKDEQERELELLKSIETVAQVVYPLAKAYIFGSRLSYLGFPDSDVDIFLDCENVYYDNICSNKQSTKYLETLQNLLLPQQDSWIVEEALLRTRVPILKLRHVDTNLKCDISFLNGLGVEKSKLIRHFNNAYPMCRQLILFLKKWLKNCRLVGAAGISSYAASWFLIFYLQTENILPSVHSLLETKQKKLVDGWNCNFTDNIPVTTKNLTFKHLLKRFFLFYSTFDYQSNVICPLLGKFIKKSSFTRSSELPIEMDLYKKCLNTREIEFFRVDSPMCIQDPVDQSQNITKAIPKHLLRCFIEYCAVSAQYL